MAEVAQDHETLIHDVNSADPPQGSAMFWWLGQHSFIVKTSKLVVYIDPYFDPVEARQTPPLLTPKQAQHADIVLITHGHSDHLSPMSLRGMKTASPDALFICPRTEARRLEKEAGIPSARIRPLSAGESIRVYSSRITAVKAKHETFDEHPTLGFPFLGYVVESGGVKFYHAGDTIMYDGLRATLARWAPFDAMFLPINGRDAERYPECLGNMTFQEAVELAGETQVKLAVPSHYDMFIGNQEDPSRFVRYLEAKYPGTRSWVGPAGSQVSFP